MRDSRLSLLPLIAPAKDCMPLKVEYILTPLGEELIPALDIIYIWSIKRMNERNIPIDPDAFVVHQAPKYTDALGAIMDKNGFVPFEIKSKS